MLGVKRPYFETTAHRVKTQGFGQRLTPQGRDSLGGLADLKGTGQNSNSKTFSVMTEQEARNICEGAFATDGKAARICGQKPLRLF